MSSTANSVASAPSGSGSTPGDAPDAAIRRAEGERPPQASQPPESRGPGQRGAIAGRRRDSVAALRPDRRGGHAAQHDRAREHPERRHRRGLRPRAARAAVAGSGCQRHPGQHLQIGLRRAQRQARASAHHVPGRPPSAAGHRSHRERRRPPRRRQLADGRRAPPGWLARERHHSAARRRRSAALDPAVPRRAAQGRGPGRRSGR